MKNKLTAVVPAAGKSQRLKANIPKPYIKIANVPILIYTLRNLEKSPKIDDIILVVQKRFLKQSKDLVRKFKIKKVKKIVSGGDTRTKSVSNGLKAAGHTCDLIMIHDGARPFLTEDIIGRSINTAKKYGAAVVAVPVKPTMKILDNKGFVEKTLDRKNIWSIQTPQVFKRELIQKAYTLAEEAGINGTDDAYLVERLGKKVKVVQGSYRNIKITTKEDLVFAEGILKAKGRRL